MGLETPKPFTPEEKEKQKSRIMSDAKLVHGGAELRDDGSIRATRTQVENAKAEKEEEKPYHEMTNVNGIRISVGWDTGYKDYTVYFPDLELGEDAYEKGVSDQVIRINTNPKTAKKVYDYVKQTAEEEKDVYKLFKKVESFIYKIRDEEDD